MPPPDLGTLQLGQRTQAEAGRTQGAILGKGAAISQDRWQRSLHVSNAPRNSHQLGSALP